MKQIILIFSFLSAAFGQSCSSIPLGFNLGNNGGRLGGFVPFPGSAYWHRDISTATADSSSASYIADVTQGGDRRIRFDYPPSTGSTVEGFHYHVVSGKQPRINVYYDRPGAIPDESDPGPMPIPLGPIVQNSLVAGIPVPDWVAGANSDGHVVVIDRDACVLYELFGVLWDGHALHAALGAVFDLLGGDQQRPLMWASGSVSGLPLFPGWLRDEELSGAVEINHPISVSLAVMAGSGNFYPKHSFIAPASHHQYGFSFNPWWHPSNLPVGAILRLKPGFDVSGYPAQGQRILNAMKKYGLIFVDGGNTVDLYSASGYNWDQATTAYAYDNLKVLQDASNFDVITSGNPIYCDPLYATAGYNGGNTPLCPNSTSSLTGEPPAIHSFTAVDNGNGMVLLSWSVTGGTRLKFITPQVGAVTTNSVLVPRVPGTVYTLTVQNFYGRQSAAVTAP